MKSFLTLLLFVFSAVIFEQVPLQAEVVYQAELVRDYSKPATASEKKDIHYIVTTLANKPLAKLYQLKPTLQRVGDRVDHVHPLRFLECIFSDEELKVGIRNIKGRGWVWGDFFDGLKGSLQQEASRGNMGDDLLGDFCLNLNLDIDIVYDSVRRKDWAGFVNLLIQHIPREGDSGRYDM